MSIGKWNLSFRYDAFKAVPNHSKPHPAETDPAPEELRRTCAHSRSACSQEGKMRYWAKLPVFHIKFTKQKERCHKPVLAKSFKVFLRQMFIEWQFPLRGDIWLPYNQFCSDTVIKTSLFHALSGVYRKTKLRSGIHTSHHYSHFFRLPNTQHLLTNSCSLRTRRTAWPELAFPLKLFKYYNLSLFCLYTDTFCWQFPCFWTLMSLSVPWTHNNKWKTLSLWAF